MPDPEVEVVEVARNPAVVKTSPFVRVPEAVTVDVGGKTPSAAPPAGAKVRPGPLIKLVFAICLQKTLLAEPFSVPE